MLRICSLLVLAVLAAPVAAAPVLTGTARIIDGDTLEIGALGERVRLHGIDAPERGQGCVSAKGKSWACGEAARKALAELSRGTVRCEGIERDRYDRLVAKCSAGGRDLGAAMVEAGAAFAYRKYSMDYVAAENRARAAGRGIWSGEAIRPADYRAAQAPAPQAAPATCAIKGNISKNGRLYHLPGSRAYAATRISERHGERWFCSEAEALAAGWRRAGR